VFCRKYDETLAACFKTSAVAKQLAPATGLSPLTEGAAGDIKHGAWVVCMRSQDKLRWLCRGVAQHTLFNVPLLGESYKKHPDVERLFVGVLGLKDADDRDLARWVVQAR
jgi:hypothetical protein